jgi:hypothetical protein
MQNPPPPPDDTAAANAISSNNEPCTNPDEPPPIPKEKSLGHHYMMAKSVLLIWKLPESPPVWFRCLQSYLRSSLSMESVLASHIFHKHSTDLFSRLRECTGILQHVQPATT